MATLTGNSIASSYTSLLKLDGNTDSTVAGNNSNAIQVKTGDDDATPLYLNTDRLGIGGQPSVALDVSGQLKVATNTDSATAGVIRNTHATGYGLKINGSSDSTRYALTVNDNDDDTTFLQVLGNGNVGIGLTPVANRLHLHEPDSTQVFAHFTNTTTGTSHDDGLLVGLDASENVNIWNRENTSILFATNNTERMRIANDGKIGIGTSSPSDDMDIADSNDYVQLNLDCFSTTNTHHGTLVFKKSSNATIGTRASTDDGEALGFIGFNGTNTSSASARGAYIYVTQNGSAGSSNVPAKMAFSTSSNSAAIINMILDENSRISLSNNDGDANNTTIFGYLAGNSQTSGSDQNCYFGHESGKANVYGDDNVCIGFQSGLALGASSGSVQNSLVGSLSGTAITDGDYNTFLGYRTGSTGTNDITTGTFNTFIGKGVAGSSASATNQTAIGI